LSRGGEKERLEKPTGRRLAALRVRQRRAKVWAAESERFYTPKINNSLHPPAKIDQRWAEKSKSKRMEEGGGKRRPCKVKTAYEFLSDFRTAQTAARSKKKLAAEKVLWERCVG